MSYDVTLFIEIHKQTAIALFGDRLDENRNIVGADYYFDEAWRLHKRN